MLNTSEMYQRFLGKVVVKPTQKLGMQQMEQERLRQTELLVVWDFLWDSIKKLMETHRSLTLLAQEWLVLS
jgi:hypothetical protein